MDCLFCSIVKGEIPAAKVFENETVLAFLDVNPLTKGHALVVPKRHFENIFDIEKEVLGHVASAAKELSQNMKRGLGATAVNLVNASGPDAEQSVFHFHLHVIPRYEHDDLHLNDWWQGKVRKAAPEELSETAQRLQKL
jgi:histidine triad (HIT) family protein